MGRHFKPKKAFDLNSSPRLNKEIIAFISEVKYHLGNGGYARNTVFGRLYEKSRKIINKIEQQ